MANVWPDSATRAATTPTLTATGAITDTARATYLTAISRYM
jgi:hypothetical protein